MLAKNSHGLLIIKLVPLHVQAFHAIIFADETEKRSERTIWRCGEQGLDDCV